MKENLTLGRGLTYIMWFQKISMLPYRRDWKFRGRRGGFLKTPKFKAMYEAKLEFPEGWGGQRANHKADPFCGRGKDGYFLEPHVGKRWECLLSCLGV